MSMPNIPDINPDINIDRNDALNIVLSSIGMEELALAHILNAEGEKIQFALGTLDTAKEAASLDEIMEVNRSSNKMLRDVIKQQMLMCMKMEDVVELSKDVTTTPADPTPVAPEEPVTPAV